MKEIIDFKLNGSQVCVSADPGRMLLWVLRTDLGLTGTKFGCGEGLCGSCTVLVNGRAERSCQLPLKEVRNKEVLTIEGLAADGRLHPLQEAFVEHNAMQCGFCTSGLILTAYGLLLKNPKPSRAEIVGALDDNFCRCGSHSRVLQAVETAAGRMRGGRK
jgi:aerobic-type carbon monoxide dehydrogenase small subunit (CoxS/CutS family)